MSTKLKRGLLICLLLMGCGSNTGSKPDAYTQLPQVDAPPPPPSVDAGGEPILTPDGGGGGGCDEDAMGVDYCIKNPGTSIGGGVVPTRLAPVPWQSCR